MDVWQVQVYEVDLIRKFRYRMGEQSVIKLRFASIYHHVCKSEGRVAHAGHSDFFELQHLAFVDRHKVCLVRVRSYQLHLKHKFVICIYPQPVVLQYAADTDPSGREADVVELSAEVEKAMGSGIVVEEIAG